MSPMLSPAPGVQGERIMLLSELGFEVQPDSILLLTDVYEPSGRLVSGPHSPEIDEFIREHFGLGVDHFAGDAAVDSAGNRYIFSGVYAVDNIADDHVALILVSKQRCTVRDWCNGHLIAHDRTDEKLLHLGVSETVYDSAVVHASVQLYQEGDDAVVLDLFVNTSESLDETRLTEQTVRSFEELALALRALLSQGATH